MNKSDFVKEVDNFSLPALSFKYSLKSVLQSLKTAIARQSNFCSIFTSFSYNCSTIFVFWRDSNTFWSLAVAELTLFWCGGKGSRTWHCRTKQSQLERETTMSSGSQVRKMLNKCKIFNPQIKMLKKCSAVRHFC